MEVGKWQRNIVSIAISNDDECNDLIAVDNDGLAWLFPLWRSDDDELKVWVQLPRLPRNTPDKPEF